MLMIIDDYWLALSYIQVWMCQNLQLLNIHIYSSTVYNVKPFTDVISYFSNKINTEEQSGRVCVLHAYSSDTVWKGIFNIWDHFHPSCVIGFCWSLDNFQEASRKSLEICKQNEKSSLWQNLFEAVFSILTCLRYVKKKSSCWVVLSIVLKM